MHDAAFSFGSSPLQKGQYSSFGTSSPWISPSTIKVSLFISEAYCVRSEAFLFFKTLHSAIWSSKEIILSAISRLSFVASSKAPSAAPISSKIWFTFSCSSAGVSSDRFCNSEIFFSASFDMLLSTNFFTASFRSLRVVLSFPASSGR